VNASPKSQNEVLLASSIPAGGASLESILCTRMFGAEWSPSLHCLVDYSCYLSAPLTRVGDSSGNFG
jgi:hypothetical protein